MFGLGWYEILLIAIVAVVIVGPKDLPMVLRTVLGLSRKAQAITRDFRRGIDDLAKETGLDEVKKDLQSVGKGNIGGLGEKFFDDSELKRQLSVTDPDPDPVAGLAKAGKAAPETPSKPAPEPTPDPVADLAKAGKAAPETPSKPAPEPTPDPANTQVAQSAAASDADERS